MADTSEAVAGSSGSLPGTTWSTAVGAVLLIVEMDTTSGSCWSAEVTVEAALLASAELTSRTISSGPLSPGPKSSAMVS